jgi:hypothetical protein
MDIKIGDIYIRDSDERVYRVKNIDNKMVVLEAENGQLSLTDIFGLEKAYSKKEPNPPQ